MGHMINNDFDDDEDDSKYQDDEEIEKNNQRMAEIQNFLNDNQVTYILMQKLI